MKSQFFQTAAKRCVTQLARHLQRFPRLSRKLDALYVHLHNVHINFNYDHQTNGERWLLERLAGNRTLDIAFDVGANQGDWTQLMLDVQPAVRVHCFEICPPTFDKLFARFSNDDRITLNRFGLSDCSGNVDVKYSSDSDHLSSLVEVVCSSNTQTMKVRVTTGKQYCLERNISKLDFLKLDVEGAEHLVLKGFDEFLKPGTVPVVQFEYGMVNIVSKFLLRDFYHFFTELGYKVGKLFPNSVRFREYRFEDEDFRGPNYVAASPKVASLLTAGAR